MTESVSALLIACFIGLGTAGLVRQWHQHVQDLRKEHAIGRREHFTSQQIGSRARYLDQAWPGARKDGGK